MVLIHLMLYIESTTRYSSSPYINVHTVINPRRACARVTVLGLCVCPAGQTHTQTKYQLSVQPKVHVPTASAQSGKHFKYGVFCIVQKLWREKANKLSTCLPRHHMAPMERHFATNCEDRAFFGSFKV